MEFTLWHSELNIWTLLSFSFTPHFADCHSKSANLGPLMQERIMHKRWQIHKWQIIKFMHLQHSHHKPILSFVPSTPILNTLKRCWVEKKLGQGWCDGWMMQLSNNSLYTDHWHDLLAALLRWCNWRCLWGSLHCDPKVNPLLEGPCCHIFPKSVLFSSSDYCILIIMVTRGISMHMITCSHSRISFLL